MKLFLPLFLLILISCGSNYDQAKVDKMWKIYNKLEKSKVYEGLDSEFKTLTDLANDLDIDDKHVVRKLLQKRISKQENKLKKIILNLKNKLSPHLANPDNSEIDLALLTHFNDGHLEKYPEVKAHIQKVQNIKFNSIVNESKDLVERIVFLTDPKSISALGIILICRELSQNAKAEGKNLLVKVYFNKKEYELNPQAILVGFRLSTKDHYKKPADRKFKSDVYVTRFVMLRRLYEDFGVRYGLTSIERQAIYLELSKRQHLINGRYNCSINDEPCRKRRSQDKTYAWKSYAKEIGISPKHMAKIDIEGSYLCWLSYTGGGVGDKYNFNGKDAKKRFENMLRNKTEIRY